MVGEGVIVARGGRVRQARADPDRAQATSRCSRRTSPKRRSPRCPTPAQIDLTIDRRLQQALEKLGGLRARQIDDKVSVAIVVADHATGDILASVGSAGLFNEASDGYVDMTEAVRSPGSTLKPLIYGLGFELGLCHPESLIEDRPTAFGGYVPVNFDGFSPRHRDRPPGAAPSR